MPQMQVGKSAIGVGRSLNHPVSGGIETLRNMSCPVVVRIYWGGQLNRYVVSVLLITLGT
ncbi:MAG: hypothetical protein LBJ67_00385 [Planctomycetaceae bacterium]|nr:hypothetical protein [Planctomycetaceae bacterium]